MLRTPGARLLGEPGSQGRTQVGGFSGILSPAGSGRHLSKGTHILSFSGKSLLQEKENMFHQTCQMEGQPALKTWTINVLEGWFCP
jgi:hypothetical protein